MWLGMMQIIYLYLDQMHLNSR